MKVESLLTSWKNPACYNQCMFDASRSEQIRVKVFRDGQPEPPDTDWTMTTPEERIEAVWTLTELCMAWNEHSAREPRLQRTVTRLQRAQR